MNEKLLVASAWAQGAAWGFNLGLRAGRGWLRALGALERYGRGLLRLARFSVETAHKTERLGKAMEDLDEDG